MKQMSSCPLCLGLCVVLWLVAPPASPFSHGASHASCQDMSPGHIRAHPQDPQNSHVTLRTSHSSYLPGQLLTVTVRGSRDFMGFLLQARSEEGSRVRPSTAAKARMGSTRLGPIVMGGAWTLAPPGTHRLRCLSEGDTLTHSDKQLKRNLSFVWRAPDVPMGDLRFYITVVQSYFVYWAGIGSVVVRDGIRRPWSGRDTTGVDRERMVSHVTVFPAINPHTTLNQQTYRQTASPATTTTNSEPSNTSVETARDVVRLSSYVTSESSADQPTNQVVNKTNSPVGPQTRARLSDTYAPSGLSSDVTENPASDSGRTTSGPPSLLPSRAFLSPVKNDELEKLEGKINFYDSNTPTFLENKVTTLNPEYTDLFLHSSNQTGLYTTSTPKTSPPPRTSVINPAIFHFLTSIDPTALPTSTDGINVGSWDQPLPQPVIDLPEPQTENNSHGPKNRQKQKPDPPEQHTTLASSTQPPTMSSFQQTIKAKTQELLRQRNQSQPEIQAEDLSFDLQPQLQTRTESSFQWRTFQPSVTPTSLNLLLMLRRRTTFTPNEGQDLPAKTKAIRPISASTSPDITQQPHVTTLHPSANPPSFTTLRYLLGVSSPVSKQSSFRTTSFTDSTSSSRIHPKTPPVLYTLPPANPISTPPQPSRVHHSSTFPMTQSPSTTPSSRSSESLSSDLYLAPVTVSTSVWSSPQHVPGSTVPSPATTISPNLLSSVSSAPVSTPNTYTNHSKSSPSSSISSSSMSLQSTSPHPGPSPAPRQSLYDPLTSSISPFPSQTPTRGQIQTQSTLKGPEINRFLPTPKTMVHPNPKPHPNFDPNFKINTGQEFKPKPPKTEIKPKRPTSPSETPEREGKYPDVIPRHRAWELVMLLACSAGLGMVMVVGVRYVYRQACGKHTQVTLNDRERDYGSGERGLIHVQECGDLVRVRRIRDNSFVLLAEYDILAAPAD